MKQVNSMTAEQSRILVVDDDPIAAESLAEYLTREGYSVTTALNAAEARSWLTPSETGPQTRPFSLVVCDVALPGLSGSDFLREIRARHPRTACIMLSGYGTVESAVEALRLGAVDYLVKPVVDAELRAAVERGMQQHALMSENVNLRQQLDQKYALDNVLGSDPRMGRIFELVEAVSPTRTTVLMSGESGTGKSLIAHAIHLRSPRKSAPFVEIACGSIPETLLESELFGHVKGAFTGAYADKQGKFLAADGGTIFLDEINSAPPAMQLKLLRVLQERKFEPVGSTQTIEVDARVILATNQPLEQLVADGRFRQDLYYRINVVKIDLPPLRSRTADVPVLAEAFLRKHAAEVGKQIIGFSAEAMDALRRYSFPGNVRELQNIIERAAVLTRGQRIEIADLPPQLLEQGSVAGRLPQPALTAAIAEDSPWVPMSLEEALRGPERRILERALQANGYNRQKTADQLGINRTTLYKKMKAHGMLDGEEEPRLAS